jgi:hypothetical protein
MKRWAWVVAGLYCLLLAVLTVPAGLLAFAPRAKLTEGLGVYLCWPYWVWLAVMLIGQWALLSVPVDLAGFRPVRRGPVWRTVLAGGLMAGGLAAGAILSIYEFVFRDKGDGNWIWGIALALGVLIWCLWTLVFLRANRSLAPSDLVSRQCRALFRGSILELLIAVPTHIVARYRDYCCAGFMTFIGLTMGISVMLFSFGPAVFVLYVQRWKRLHPARPDETDAGNQSRFVNQTNP